MSALREPVAAARLDPAPAPPSPPRASAPLPPAEPSLLVRSARWWRPYLRIGLVVLLVVIAALFALALIGGRYHRPRLVAAAEPASADERAGRIARAEQSIARVMPRGMYVVVDSFGNRLRVYKNGELQRRAVCSTGSRTALRDPATGRIWVFKTPLGEHRVRNKVRDPVWTKPDWAFIEEGLPIPKSRSERYDDVSLGDYALYLGDGYLIHGTIFQTLLGTPVTHGCIRLGDADLEYVYRNVPVGSRVYIY